MDSESESTTSSGAGYESGSGSETEPVWRSRGVPALEEPDDTGIVRELDEEFEVLGLIQATRSR